MASFAPQLPQAVARKDMSQPTKGFILSSVGSLLMLSDCTEDANAVYHP